MKKERIMKYLVMVFAMTLSFFMFSSRLIKAEEKIGVKVNDLENLFFEVEAVDLNNLELGYKIIGVYDTCLGEESCLNSISTIENLVIPGNYNEYKIVSISDGSTVAGVLQELTSKVSGGIDISENIETIGQCAFCGFDSVNEITLAESVTLIGNYAFADSDNLKTLVVKRFDSNSEDKVSAIKADTFALSNFEKIVFQGKGMLSHYRDSAIEWSTQEDLRSKYTYKIIYRFNKDNGLYEDKEYYYGFLLNDIPNNAYSNSDEEDNSKKIGFNFVGWYSDDFENTAITSESYATILDAAAIHSVSSKWELVAPTITMKSYHEENEIENNTFTYNGKDDGLKINVDVVHILDVDVTYFWKLKYSNGIEEILIDESDNLYNQSYYNVYFVGQSGTYTCSVTISYDEYTKEVSSSLVVTILPRNLIVNINDNETIYGTYAGPKLIDEKYYTIDSSTSLAENEIVKAFTAETYVADNLVANSYSQVLTGKVTNIGYDDELYTDNYLNNYNIIYNFGDLLVKAKEIQLVLEENFIFEYGEDKIFTNNYLDENVYGGKLELTITYVRENSSCKDAGEYKIIGAIVDNPNYIIVYDEVNSTGKVIIGPKEVEVLWNVGDDYVYDTREKAISSSYIDNDGNVVSLNVEIRKNGEISSLINAGTYNLTAVMINVDDNYKLIGFETNVIIEKAQSSFIGEKRQTVTYNGQAQKVEVSLNHNESIVEYGDYSACKNAQNFCTVTVSAKESENYKSILQNFELVIKKYELVVEPDVFEIEYGTSLSRDKLAKTYKGVNNENVDVYFPKAGDVSDNLNVGYYDVTNTPYTDGINAVNYKISIVDNSWSNKIKIIPKAVQIRYFYYEGLVYDGSVKTISAVPFIGSEKVNAETVGLSVDYNGISEIKNAGKYRANAYLSNTNYCIEGSNYLEFEVAKATYDISKLKLNDKKVKFNFKSHFINLEGELPAGLIATYTIDDHKGNGTFAPNKHTVKVSFMGDYENYNYVEPLIATLYVDMSWVWITIGLIFGVVGICFAILYILASQGKIRLARRIKSRTLRKVARMNKEIMLLNEEFKNKRLSLENKDNEIGEIEDSYKFVKKKVNSTPETLIEMSFVDELFKSSYLTKQCYSEVKNELLSYEGITSKIKRDFETFYVNNVPVAKVDVVDGVLELYLALDPSMYDKEEYHHEDVGKKRSFMAVPLKMIVNSIESLRHAKMFIRIIRKRERLKSSSEFVPIDYVSVYTAKEGSFKMFKKAFVKKGSKEADKD